MLEIKIKKQAYQCPENWQECTPEQVRTFLLVRRIPEPDRKRAVQETLVQAYLGMTNEQWAKLVLGFEQWKTIKAFASWVYEKPLDEKPFDFFDFEGVRYWLPEPNYTNTTALELSLANMLYVEFAHPTEPDLTAIEKLIATFCRPVRSDWESFQISPEWNGDIRQPFNQARMEATAKQLASLDISTKIAFLTYFEQMNTAFLEEYSQLFGENKTEPRYEDGTGWLMILKSVAKDGLWNGFENVCKQPARTVWAFMLDDILDIRQQEAEYEKQKEENANFNK